MSVKAMKWAYGLFEVIDLSPAERAVLLALCWDHTEARGCYPSQDRISTITGYRRRHVNTVLKDLEAMGFIWREKVRTGGKFEKTTYRLFGSEKRNRVRPSAQGKDSDRVRPPAHGDRVRPSAQNRGIINRGDDEKIIDLPAIKKSGGFGR